MKRERERGINKWPHLSRHSETYARRSVTPLTLGLFYKIRDTFIRDSVDISEKLRDRFMLP